MSERKPSAIALAGADGRFKTLQEIEDEAILAALQGNASSDQTVIMTAAARQLGIGRTTLYRKLKEIKARTEAATRGSP